MKKLISKSFYLLPVIFIFLSLMVLSACGSTTPPASQKVTVDIYVSSDVFSKSSITVPANAAVTVNFDNRDSGKVHNFAVYTAQDYYTPVFQGQDVTGPGMVTYTFTSPVTPGTYYFRSDPDAGQNMNGTFIVQ
jgi:plastocyanin